MSRKAGCRWKTDRCGVGYAVVLLLLTGCATIDYSQHAKKQEPHGVKGLPKIRIDIGASLVAIASEEKVSNWGGRCTLSGDDFSPTEILHSIGSYWNMHASNKQTLPARAVLSVRLGRCGGHQVSNVMLGVFVPIGVAYWGLGLPSAWSTADARLTLEMNGRTYSAQKSATCLSGLYYPGNPWQCAISEATIAAVAAIAKQVQHER